MNSWMNQPIKKYKTIIKGQEENKQKDVRNE